MTPNVFFELPVIPEIHLCSAVIAQSDNADETDSRSADELATARPPAKRFADVLCRGPLPAQRKSTPACRDAMVRG